MARKNEIDKETYNKICIILKKSGISSDILKLANKMHLNLPRLFISKLIEDEDEKSKEDLIKNLLGVYGNYEATKELIEAGFKVENEEQVPVYDGSKKKSVDLVFSNQKGAKVYCEVKISKQILDYQKTYVDADKKSLNDSKFCDDTKVYQSIGKKLLNQVDALNSTGIPVIVFIVRDCYAPEIIEKLQNKKVYVMRLKKDFSSINKEVRQIVNTAAEMIEEEKTLGKKRL